MIPSNLNINTIKAFHPGSSYIYFIWDNHIDICIYDIICKLIITRNYDFSYPCAMQFAHIHDIKELGILYDSFLHHHS